MNGHFSNIKISNKIIRTLKFRLREIIKKYVYIPKSIEELKRICGDKSSSYYEFSFSGGSIFVIKKGCDLLKQIIGLLKSDKFIVENISDEMLNKELRDIIGNCILNDKYKEIEKLVDEMMSHLDRFDSKFKVVFIIEGLSLIDIDSFSIGEVIFRKINDEIASDFYEFDTHDQNLKEKIEKNKKNIIGKTVAEYICLGDEQKSREKAFKAIQQAINVLRFYYSFGYGEKVLRYRNFQINIAGYLKGGNEDAVLFDLTSDKKIRFYGRGVGRLQDFEISKETLEWLRNNGLDDFSDLLKKQDYSEIEKSLIDSLFWIGEAVDDSNRQSAYIKFMISIETFFTQGKSDLGLTEWVAKCIAIMVGNSPEEVQKIYHEVKKDKGMYDVRSLIVHKGAIIDVQLEKIARLAHISFMRILGLRANGYQEKEQVYKEIDKLAKILNLPVEEGNDIK